MPSSFRCGNNSSQRISDILRLGEGWGSFLASNKSKPGHGLTINRHRFQKHLLRSHPQAVVAVFLPVDDEFFLGFAVQSHAEDRVLVSLVVPVAPWLHGGHGFT